LIEQVLNHPDLLRVKEPEDACKTNDDESRQAPPILDSIDWNLFLPDNYREGEISNSGKLSFLFQLLAELHASKSEDRIVIVSNYTTTLRLLETLCVALGYPTVRYGWTSCSKVKTLRIVTFSLIRLDGGTEVQKRADIVASFNSQHSKQFIFLLSSKAGGCGLNLIGANRFLLSFPTGMCIADRPLEKDRPTGSLMESRPW
jgi:DNA repair and recombination RAD54-like protein